jgi:hypothetical protein
MPLTITEARCEIKALRMMIEASRHFITKHLVRPVTEDDPLTVSDGELKMQVQQQLEAVLAMEERIIILRRAVVAADNKAALEIGGRAMSLADWQFWRREIAPKALVHARDMASELEAERSRHGHANRNRATADIAGASLTFNLSEEYVADLNNELGQMLCLLEGQLAVKSATTFIEVTEPLAETAVQEH